MIIKFIKWQVIVTNALHMLSILKGPISYMNIEQFDLWYYRKISFVDKWVNYFYGSKVNQPDMLTL